MLWRWLFCCCQPLVHASWSSLRLNSLHTQTCKSLCVPCSVSMNYYGHAFTLRDNHHEHYKHPSSPMTGLSQHHQQQQHHNYIMSCVPSCTVQPTVPAMDWLLLHSRCSDERCAREPSAPARPCNPHITSRHAKRASAVRTVAKCAEGGAPIPKYFSHQGALVVERRAVGSAPARGVARARHGLGASVASSCAVCHLTVSIHSLECTGTAVGASSLPCVSPAVRAAARPGVARPDTRVHTTAWSRTLSYL